MMRTKTGKRAGAALMAALLFLGAAASPWAGENLVPEEASALPGQEACTVSYLGPEGTYTQEACQVFFGEGGTFLPYTTVEDAVTALENGESDYAVIPQENTIGGAVIDYVDTLLAHSDVSVVGEVELPIRQNLLTLPGASLEEIATVYSHKQGITQGKQWLSENLPDAEVLEVSSTAEGARMVAEAQDPSLAAIASAACAGVYGLSLLAEGIQQNEDNKTRFYVLFLEEPSAEEAERLAFTAAGEAEDLPGLLAMMQELDMTLVTLHDRPLKTVLGEYTYLIECRDCSYEDYTALAEANPFLFRYLGSFETR